MVVFLHLINVHWPVAKLNQVHAIYRPACDRFLKIASVRKCMSVCMLVCARLCVSTLRLPLTSGMMWHDMYSI